EEVRDERPRGGDLGALDGDAGTEARRRVVEFVQDGPEPGGDERHLVRRLELSRAQREGGGPPRRGAVRERPSAGGGGQAGAQAGAGGGGGPGPGGVAVERGDGSHASEDASALVQAV